MGLLRFFRDLKLGVKVMLVTFLILLALLMATNLIVTTGMRRMTVLVGQYRVAQEAAVLQNQFERAGRDVLAATKLLASRPGLVEAVANQDVTTVRMLALVGAAPLDLDAIAVVAPDGAYLATVGSEMRPLYTADQVPLVSLALLGVESTGVSLNEDEKTFSLGAAVPLRDASGALVGTLIAVRHVDDDFLKDLNFNRQDIQLALVSGKHILAQDFTSPELLGETSAALLDEIAIVRTLGGETLVAEELLSSADGTPYALAHAPLVVRGKAVAAIGILYNLDQLRVLDRQLTQTITRAFSVLAFVVLSIMGFFIRLGIADPIRALTSVAQQMAAGNYAQRAATKTRDEMGQLGQAFNEMAQELQQTLQGLEQRVADRTRALETSTQISRRLSTLLDQEQLVTEVVEQVQEAFAYYHVHIYLVDEATQDLVMVGGTGAAGRAMLADGHRIPRGRGLVGRAATTNTPVLVPDVGQDPSWLPNPLLPDTRAEVAVPISIGERVLGVLDVQHNVVNGLTENDVSLVASIANQVAVALQNTRLFAAAQKRARYEERVNLITQRIQDATTVEEALQISVRELGRMLNAEAMVRLRAASSPGDEPGEPVLMAHDQAEAGA